MLRLLSNIQICSNNLGKCRILRDIQCDLCGKRNPVLLPASHLRVAGQSQRRRFFRYICGRFLLYDGFHLLLIFGGIGLSLLSDKAIPFLIPDMQGRRIQRQQRTNHHQQHDKSAGTLGNGQQRSFRHQRIEDRQRHSRRNYAEQPRF